MNILLIGENIEHLNRLKGLLELSFPKSMIAAEGYQSSYKSIYDYHDKWNLIILFTFAYEKKKNKLLFACKSVSLPVLCIVDRNMKNNYLDLLKKGSKGIIGHDAPLDILRNGIRFAKEGGVYFDPKIAKEIDFSLTQDKNDSAECPNLSSRQWEVLKLVAKGMTSEEIAEMLSMKQSAVIVHQNHIVNEMKSKTLPSAVAKGFYYGWLKNI